MISSRENTAVENEARHRDRWLISYADLVTLLLALFIVMYAASDKERARQIAESFNSQNTGGRGILPGGDSDKEERAKYEQQLMGNPILSPRLKIRQGSSGLIVSLSEAGFFASGEASINPESETIISTLADSLRAGAAQIRVEGHTDSTPISTGKFPSNWELSTARASTVLARFIERGIPPERLSAAGYAGFQPIADNATPEGRAQNRRVDVVIIDKGSPQSTR
jgi:chemotaxis protein MotB